MADRRLVVVESDPADPAFGALMAVAPGTATGIPIPAFRSGAVLPAAGTLQGEAFINTNTGVASVWDGAAWKAIARPTVTLYATDGALLGDNPPDDTVALAQSSGNFYVRVTGGWRRLGITTYPTEVGLLGASPADGTVAVAQDTGTLYLRTAGAWLALTKRQFTTIADIQAWAAPDGAEAVLTPNGLHFSRVGGAWAPKSVWTETEVNILADTGQMAGQMAVSSDTGRLFVWDGTTWNGSPVRHYATEAALIADTPPDGVIAFADDTGNVFGRANGAWVRTNGLLLSRGNTFGAGTPVDGDMWFDTRSNTLRLHHNGAWTDGVNYSEGTTLPVAPDGAFFYNTAKERPYAHMGGTWRELGGPHFARIDANNSNRIVANMSPSALRYVRFRGHFLNQSGTNRLAVFMFDGAQQAIDWGHIEYLRATQFDINANNGTWKNIDKSMVYTGPAGVQVTAFDGMRANTRVFLQFELAFAPDEVMITYKVHWNANNNNHWIVSDGVAYINSTSVLNPASANPGVTLFGLKTFNGDNRANAGGNISARGLVEYF